jgi:hypothetical protein
MKRPRKFEIAEKRGNPKPLPPKLRSELKALAMPESEIDATEMPPITDYRAAVPGPKPARPGRLPSPPSISN